MLSKENLEIVQKGLQAAKDGNFSETPNFNETPIVLKQEGVVECEVSELNAGDFYCIHLYEGPYIKLPNGNSFSIVDREEILMSGKVFPVKVELKTTPILKMVYDSLRKTHDV